MEPIRPESGGSMETDNPVASLPRHANGDGRHSFARVLELGDLCRLCANHASRSRPETLMGREPLVVVHGSDSDCGVVKIDKPFSNREF
jgi:hypothetical protein